MGNQQNYQRCLSGKGLAKRLTQTIQTETKYCSDPAPNGRWDRQPQQKNKQEEALKN